MRWKFTERQQKQRKSNILVTSWCFSERSHISNQKQNFSDCFHSFDSVGSHRTPDQGYKVAYGKWGGTTKMILFSKFCFRKCEMMSLKIRFWRKSFTNELLLRGIPLLLFSFTFPQEMPITQVTNTRKHKLRKANSSSVNMCLTCGCYVRIQNPIWPYLGTKNYKNWRSKCPDCFPAAKYYHYCLPILVFLLLTQNVTPFEFRNCPALGLSWLTNFIMDTSFKIAYCSVTSLSSMVFSLHGKKIYIQINFLWSKCSVIKEKTRDPLNITMNGVRRKVDMTQYIVRFLSHFSVKKVM